MTRALVVAPRRRGSFTLKDSDESSEDDEVPSEEDEGLSEDDQELSEEENIEAVSRFLPPLGRLRVECKSTAFLSISIVFSRHKPPEISWASHPEVGAPGGKPDGSLLSRLSASVW